MYIGRKACWADPQIWSGQCTTHVLARIVPLLSASPGECGVLCRDKGGEEHETGSAPHNDTRTVAAPTVACRPGKHETSEFVHSIFDVPRYAPHMQIRLQ